MSDIVTAVSPVEIRLEDPLADAVMVLASVGKPAKDRYSVLGSVDMPPSVSRL